MWLFLRNYATLQMTRLEVVYKQIETITLSHLYPQVGQN